MANVLFSWLDHRAGGVLLHPTSLPGPYGIGSLAPGAYRFIETLAQAGMRYWQVCPLGPTGFGDSPYQAFSSFAGNPYLIDLDALAAKGLLSAADLSPLAGLSETAAAYGEIYEERWPVMRVAFDNWIAQGKPELYGPYSTFAEQQSAWLDAFTGFMALKNHFGGKPWQQWPTAVRSLAQARQHKLWRELASDRSFHGFLQYCFFGQWEMLREFCREKKVQIIGDVPIFVALDSADTWGNPEYFELDPTGTPKAVAGVPPDYFSPEGQLWGNPLYNWKTLKADGYRWWINRLEVNFALFDVVRIDHFRGFAAYWRVAAKAKTAENGKWVKGPGVAFFKELQKALPQAHLIAEDLGVITEEVVDLLEKTGLPGMAVLQFAFGGAADNFYLPHNLKPNQIVYSGTHDNDTTLGWYKASGQSATDHFRRYLRVSGDEPHWDLIREALGAVCRIAVIPAQDILGLGSEARLNAPGSAMGNWQWRMTGSQLDQIAGAAGYLRDLNALYGRDGHLG